MGTNVKPANITEDKVALPPLQALSLRTHTALALFLITEGCRQDYAEQTQHYKAGISISQESSATSQRNLPLPGTCKCCKFSWSVQAPGYNLQTLPISINLLSSGICWIKPCRSPLRKLSALLLTEELKAWGRYEPSPGTGPVTLAVTPALF